MQKSYLIVDGCPSNTAIDSALAFWGAESIFNPGYAPRNWYKWKSDLS